MNSNELVEVIRTLVLKGVITREGQAEALGVSRATLMRWLKNANATTQQLSHSKWIPWQGVSESDWDHVTYRYLTMLSQAAQRKPTRHVHLRASALHWAETLLSEGKDITYRQGWREVPADPSDWHLRRLYDAADSYMCDLDD